MVYIAENSANQPSGRAGLLGTVALGKRVAFDPDRKVGLGMQMNRSDRLALCNLYFPWVLLEALKLLGLRCGLFSRGACSLRPGDADRSKSVYQWVKKGSLTAIRIGAKLKFDPADLAAFLASRRTC